ncbi:MAG TPA: Rieske 2Fe-2S domain-containing protein [Chloroflexota bacterium]|nr:Rieske 2Fe-2S domain-containing protein [Chloroflexota bacterium]
MTMTDERPDAERTSEGAPAPWEDFVHTGPGTLAGRYMRRFWQPVYLAEELAPGQAKPLRIMSEDFTLYRGEGGTPHVVAFRCAHRGTQLSTGWVEGDCIRCFYHGWKYDASGQCVEMPAEDPSFPPKVKVKSYPTVEYLGLVFAYLGEGEPPALPRYPDFEDEGVLVTSSYLRPCNYFQNIENGLDHVHVTFVHAVSGFTDAGLRGVPRVLGEESEWGITQRGVREGGATRVLQYGMPNVQHIKGSPDGGSGGWVDALSWRVPVDDTQHLSFNVNLVHVTGEAAARYRETAGGRGGMAPAEVNELSAAILRGERRIQDLRDHPNLVNIQDTVAQVGQGVIADRTAERLGRSDVLVILLRKIWARELRALAEGRPLKEWRRTERLLTTAGV